MQAPTCPKHMAFGPCGGVDFDGGCEAAEHRCTFLDQALPVWDADRIPDTPKHPLLTKQRPIVVADLVDQPLDADSTSRTAAMMAGHIDAALFGDSGWARVQLPPAYRARLVAEHDIVAWAGLNCRDRNRVALEGELAGLADVGAAVLCLTGDHPVRGDRPDAKPVFDLDSTRLAAMAARMGLLTAVAENPVAPEVAHRPRRLSSKISAGAQVAFLNHPGSPEVVTRFVADLDALGRVVPLIVCVPLVVSPGGLSRLSTFTALALPEGFVRVIVDSADPYREGVRQAVEFARAVLGINGVIGVNLSAVAGAGEEQIVVEAAIRVSQELRHA